MMNQLFCHPETITIKKAVYYDIAPIPLPTPFKDGTGGVRHASASADRDRPAL